MRSTLPLSLSFILLITTLISTAQQDRFAYAVTDVTKEGVNWNTLRKLDLQTGQYSDVLFNGSEEKTVALDAATRKTIVQQPDAKYGTFLQAPFSTGVAAMAYDKRHNRLYYTPMFIDQLRYIDLSTMKVYYVTGQPLTGFGNMHSDEGKIITRMVIAPDGNGYAISNDGKAFIKFSTTKKATITQLGSLTDDPANDDMSIHERQTSWGGDMIADDNGNLIVITAPARVFVVNTENKIATYKGRITALPSNFTANGAAVDTDGNLLISSAINNDACYVVNYKTLEAKTYPVAAGVYRSSDLANSNYLTTNKNSTEIALPAKLTSNASHEISVYPNPVTASRFNVQFNKVANGTYMVELSNQMGQRMSQEKISVVSSNQVQQMAITSAPAKGVYLVRVFDVNHKVVSQQKVVVQ